MNREGAFGLLLLVLLLGGIVLFARRPAVVSGSASTPLKPYSQSNIRAIPIADEPRRYQNKEIRNIEYNADGLPVKIEIIRDYAIT